METIPNTESVYPTELCWKTGNFTDNCECEFCEHNNFLRLLCNDDNIHVLHPNTCLKFLL